MIRFILGIVLIIFSYLGALALFYCGIRAMFDDFEFGILPCSFGIILLIFAVVVTFAFSNASFRCPECNEWVDHKYCEYCGTDINPTVRCPGCDEEYSPKKVPLYCPDCGEPLAAKMGEDEK